MAEAAAPVPERVRLWPGVVALAAAALAAGAGMKFLVERPEFGEQPGAPPLGGVAEVAVSLALVALAAWFMRTTLIELALDFRRAQRNMRRLARTTAWIGSAAAAATALWAAAVCLAPVKGLGAILLPLAGIWLARAVAEGLWAGRIYGKPAVPVAIVTGLAGGLAMVVAFVAVCSVNSGYLRMVDAFRG